MIEWLRSLIAFNTPKKFVRTNKGRVGRVESVNKQVNSITISFGSFDAEGDWIIKKTVTISDSNIECYLSKKDVARELTIINFLNNNQ